MENADITIVGAGIIGLAVSSFVSVRQCPVYVLEKNLSFGQETSSRNSEVIHSGIYYPRNSLKAKTCVEGNRLIYQFCDKHNIPCKKTGKLVVAAEEKEIPFLERLWQNGRQNDVLGLRMLSGKEIKDIEPNIKAKACLFSAETGIIDAHSLMRYLFQKAKSQNAEFIFGAEVISIDKQKTGYKVTVRDTDGEKFSFPTKILINCAGLFSDTIAEMAGLDPKKEGYLLQYCKGEYFRVHSAKAGLIKHLVYPVPDYRGVSLGIHATLDLGGGLRLGPDAQYIGRDNIDYSVDSRKREKFYRSVRNFLPFIESGDLGADSAGIRPKLAGADHGFKDFVICHEEKKGFPGFINLIGIESPGLTASLAIGKYVNAIAGKIIP
ncbi:MAG: NAD(P)/FAD-dependent oxidoreductase [Candidatus Omnitrophota bacterium]